MNDENKVDIKIDITGFDVFRNAVYKVSQKNIDPEKPLSAYVDPAGTAEFIDSLVGYFLLKYSLMKSWATNARLDFLQLFVRLKNEPSKVFFSLTFQSFCISL